mgnify:CR=1 FL=1
MSDYNLPDKYYIHLKTNYNKIKNIEIMWKACTQTLRVYKKCRWMVSYYIE